MRTTFGSVETDTATATVSVTLCVALLSNISVV
jgi:hypothetical protein